MKHLKLFENWWSQSKNAPYFMHALSRYPAIFEIYQILFLQHNSEENKHLKFVVFTISDPYPVNVWKIEWIFLAK